MKINEYLRLVSESGRTEKLLNINNLKNKNDRTLIYGYDCERNTFHVYIKDKNIFTIKYNSNGIIERVLPTSNADYVPNKRVYPEYCDFEFCRLLQENDVYIPFSIYRSSQVDKNDLYTGEII